MSKTNAERQAEFRRFQKENRATEVRFNFADLNDEAKAELAEWLEWNKADLGRSIWGLLVEAKAYRTQVFEAMGFKHPPFSKPWRVDVEIIKKSK